MKRGMVLILLLCINLVSAEDVEKTYPELAEPMEVIDVGLSMDAETGDEVTIEETLPENVIFEEWNVEGSIEAKEDIDYKIEGNKHTWRFTASEETPKITYKIMLSETATGIIELKTDYSFPNAEGTVNSKVTVADEEWGYQQETIEIIPEKNAIDQEKIESVIIEEQSIIKPWMVITAITVIAAVIVLLFIFRRKKPEEVDEYET